MRQRSGAATLCLAMLTVPCVRAQECPEATKQDVSRLVDASARRALFLMPQPAQTISCLEELVVKDGKAEAVSVLADLASKTLLGALAPLDGSERLGALRQKMAKLVSAEPQEKRYGDALDVIDGGACAQLVSVSSEDSRAPKTLKGDAWTGLNQRCAVLLRADLERAADWLKPEQAKAAAPTLNLGHPPDRANPRPFAREAHDAYANLKTWYDADSRKKDKNLSALRDQVHNLMKDVGLRQTVSAQFMSGPVLSDTGATSKSSAAESQAGALAHIAWSTRHQGFGGSDDKERVDVSLSGRFGWMPALSLAPPSPAPSPAPVSSPTPGASPPTPSTSPSPAPSPAASPAAAQRTAFVADAALNLNGHIGEHGEVSAFGRAGLIRIGTDTITTIQGQQALLSNPLGAGDKSESNWFFDVGATARLHAQSLSALHEQNGLVEPALELTIGWRRENRFRHAAGLVSFDEPGERRFVRLVLASIPVKGFPKGADDGAQPLTLTFGVEREWPRRPGGLPAVTRFLVKGDVNLIKALGGK